MYKETIYQEKILTGGSILEGLAGRYPALKACRSVLYGVGQPPDDGICGNYDGLIRGCTSTDLLHWSKPQVWAETPLIGGDSHIHPLLVEHLGKLYGFFVCWREGHCPTTELFELDDAAGRWLHHPESALKGFVPFCTPQKLDDGNWILGGGRHWYEASVAISGGATLPNGR